MKFVGAVLLLVAAALVFSFTQPDAAPQMTMGLVIAFVTIGIVFAIAGTDRPEGSTRKGLDPVRMFFGGIVLVTGTIATFMAFSNPAMGLLFAVTVLGGSGYLIYDQLNRRPAQHQEQLDPEYLLRHDANASPLEKMKQNFHAGFDEELLETKNRIAMQLEALTATTHRTRTFGPLADTEIAANRGAQRREIPREDYSQYRLAELEHFGAQELKRFEMELGLEQQEREAEIDFNAVRRVATRHTAEAEAIRVELSKLHSKLYLIKQSDLPSAVKRAKVKDITDIIRGFREELHGRLGTRTPDSALDG